MKGKWYVSFRYSIYFYHDLPVGDTETIPIDAKEESEACRKAMDAMRKWESGTRKSKEVRSLEIKNPQLAYIIQL